SAARRLLVGRVPVLAQLPRAPRAPEMVVGGKFGAVRARHADERDRHCAAAAGAELRVAGGDGRKRPLAARCAPGSSFHPGSRRLPRTAHHRTAWRDTCTHSAAMACGTAHLAVAGLVLRAEAGVAARAKPVL